MKHTFAFVFLSLFLSVSAWAGFGEGMAAFKNKDYQTALKELSPLAEKGDAEAQYMVGYIYFHSYLDYDKAAQLYRKAAEQGHAAAQYRLGGMYRTGRGVSRDMAAAIVWQRKSAEQGNVEAQNHLGFMYNFGREVPLDYGEALKWYRKAARQGYAISQYNLGNMYRDGKGVRRNNIEAHKWYSLAAGQGNELAASSRDILARKMDSADIDRARDLARKWNDRRGGEKPTH